MACGRVQLIALRGILGCPFYRRDIDKLIQSGIICSYLKRIGNKIMVQGKQKQAVEAFHAGDIKSALKLASGFRLGVTRQQSIVLKRGYECMVWPDQYRRLKKDPEACIEEAKRVFKEVFA